MNNNKAKKKSLRDTIREVDELEEQERLEYAALIKKREEEKRIEHEKELAREKIRLLKGEEEAKAETETTEPEKKRFSIGSFFYHNAWWLGMAVFAIGLASLLVYQVITKPNPDMTILVITDDWEMQLKTEEIQEVFLPYITDYNGNGKTEVAVYTMPLNEDEIAYDYQKGNFSKLTAQLDMGKAVLVMTDDTADELIDADYHFMDLEEAFPDCKQVKGKGFYLADTDFAEAIGYEGKLDKDIRFSVREVHEEFSFAKKMQQTFDRDFPVFEKFVEDMTK